MSTTYTEEEQQEAFKKIANVKIYTLAQVIKIIDSSCARGAFKGEELTFVGTIYDSIKKGVLESFEIARTELNEAKETKLETIVEEEETATVTEVPDESETIPVLDSAGVQSSE